MKNIFALALALVLVGVQPLAADPLMKYTYFDAAYEWTHIDESGYDDANGLDTKLSYVVIDNLALEGGYNYLNSEVVGFDVDISTFTYGAAYWHSFCEGFDLVGRVGGIHAEVSGDVDSFGDDGVYVGGQLRSLLTDTIEGNFDVLYSHINSAGQWTYAGTTFFTLTDSVALKTSVAIDDDSNVTLQGGIRLTM